ncbi:MAG: RsmE family RNA methyltransferase [Candidatus Sulfotelmatobacter sp.]
MTRRRWIADEVSADRATLVGEHADHLTRVLRARVGQEFDIATGPAVRRGKITSIANDRVEFELGEELRDEKSAEITLLLAIFKFDRMEWAIEKCTELGVARIIPVIARRTDSHLAAASTKRAERWRRIARQAAEQSRRPGSPEIAVPIKLSEVLNVPAALRIVLSESEEQTLLRDVVKPDAPGLENEGNGIALALGPEGGWSVDEVQSFREAGWISVSLGNTILRAETAAIAATAIVASVLHTL